MGSWSCWQYFSTCSPTVVKADNHWDTPISNASKWSVNVNVISFPQGACLFEWWRATLCLYHHLITTSLLISEINALCCSLSLAYNTSGSGVVPTAMGIFEQPPWPQVLYCFYATVPLPINKVLKQSQASLRFFFFNFQSSPYRYRFKKQTKKTTTLYIHQTMWICLQTKGQEPAMIIFVVLSWLTR